MKMNTVENLLKMLDNKYKEISKYRTSLQWKFFQGRAVGAYCEDYDDSSWTDIKLPMMVDLRRGEAWLRCRITVPENVSGILVENSKAKLFSSVMTTGAEIYIDSKLVLSADYWTELRGPIIILSENVKPGETHVIAVRLYPCTEPIGIPEFNIIYSNVENVLFEIDAFMEELKFVRLIPGGNEAVERVAGEFNLRVFNESHDKLLAEIEHTRSKLSYLSNEVKKFKVHLVGHAHIDMNWLWSWRDTIETIKNTFKTMLNLMDKYPFFHFSQSQAVTYMVTEQLFPEVFNRIKRRVESGNWEATASTWVEADLNMSGNEALVRQFLYGKRFSKDKLGVDVEVCWEPDTFGHPLTMPQIVRKAGARYYYFMRCGRGFPMFWWEAPEGSRILAFNSVYNNIVYPRTVCSIAREVYEKHGLKTSMFVYGVGDHGGGPTLEDIEIALKIMDKPLLPTVVFSSAREFFREVENEVRLEHRELPIVRGELNFTFDGCYTTHADIKRYNRLCERMLVDAEKICCITDMYPRDKLADAWRKTLFNQFHDILDGSGIRETYEYSRELAEDALSCAREVMDTALEKLASSVKFREEGLPIVVFNSLSWSRRDIVKVKVPSHLIPAKPIVASSNGGVEPVQLCEDGIVFIADVPALGYSTYYLKEGTADAEMLAKDLTLENEFFRITVDSRTGTIKELYDKKANRIVFDRFQYEATQPKENNLFQVLHESPHPMSAWIIGEIMHIENLVKPEEVKLVENGPVRARIRVVYKYRRSRICSDTVLFRGIPRIDFQTSMDWREFSNENVDAPMLKVSFTPILKSTGKAVFEIPFGYAERPADGSEVPALRWVDVSDGEYGLTLLNDSKYGFDVSGNTIRMTLIRTSYSPDPTPDQGLHEVMYSIYPHKGDWKNALSFRRGFEINHPLEAVVVTKPSSMKGAKPEAMSFLEVKPENIVVSCLKKAEESEDIILRLYESTGLETDVKLKFGFHVKAVQELDLIERPLNEEVIIEGNTLTLKVKPLEIKTLKLRVT
ncbi:alpha-mannosidase [Candidatus Bathyarchaeota archaeon]|nr:alpha-mannosidase [Candidatus Bathyarchaeota archaeon]